MTEPHGGTRPHVTLNIAESADGKIAPVDKGKTNFGGPDDRVQMELLRCEADAVMIGGGTLHAEDPPLVIRDPAIQRRREQEKGAPHPLNITVCSVLPERLTEMKFFTSADTQKIFFTTERTSPDRRSAAERFGHVEVVPTNSAGRVDIAEVVRRLPGLGVKRLLVEGGGELNFSMLELGVVDEMYVTICPFLFGGRSAPTPVDGSGFASQHIRKLLLESVRQGAGGVIFLHYRVLPESPE
jgi:5-amino-6-(5-phosphoribosylamino)uracil reductase